MCKESNIDAFSTLDDRTVDTVINAKWHGSSFSERVWNNSDVLAAKLDDVMTRSVMTGASMSKAMREVRETFNTHNYYAERLIRTETNRAHNEAEALAYDNMGVEQYVFVATLDNRTSLMCQEHDGKRFKLSERKVGVNYPPLHPNCRSTVRAFIDEETEKTMVRRARNPFTGETEIVGNMNYEQWKAKHQENGTWGKPLKRNLPSKTNKTNDAISINREPVKSLSSDIKTKVDEETRKVNEHLSNEAKPITKEPVNVDDVKTRGGLTDDEAKECIKTAESVYEKATEKEPKITADVIASVEETNGKMYGLAYRLKQPSSMAGKIGADAKESGSTFQEAADDIKDAVRYTAVIPESGFTKGYQSVKKSMEDKGYTEVRCKNFYEMYENNTSCQKAVQCVYQDSSGYKFEFQFHTPSSQGAKELNHPLYEEQRKSTTSEQRKKELYDEMVEIGSYVKNPDGVLNIKS